MAPSAPHPPCVRRPRPAVVLAVLALHVLVVASLSQLTTWPDREPGPLEPGPVAVHLTWSPRPPGPAAAPSRLIARPAPPAVEAIREAAGQAPHPMPAPAIGAPAWPEAAVPPPAPAVPALQLGLPLGASAPWRQRHPALDDPRANTAHATFESRLAQAVGSNGGWVQERLDNDRIRLRRGSECIELQRSRAGQLGLGGGAVRDSWAAKDC